MTEDRLADEYRDALEALPWGAGGYFDDNFAREPDVLAAIDAEIETVLHRLRESGYLDRVREHTRALGYEQALIAPIKSEGDLSLGRWAKGELPSADSRERDAFNEGAEKQQDDKQDVAKLVKLRDLRDKWVKGVLTNGD